MHVQQSEKHLDKILNVDEFLRRIFSVIHSNDPIARELTLSERKNTHHSIRTSLDSHDEVELEAAIFAASCFAAQSRTFAVGICNKIAEMIQGLATPVEMKLKLIPISQHMHHDAQTAAKVELLLHYLQQDPRRAIKLKVLSDTRAMLQSRIAPVCVNQPDICTVAGAINGHLATICQALPPLDRDKLPTFLPTSPPPQIEPWQMYHCLKKVKVRKAPGPDAIPPTLIKEFAYELATPLTDIMNASLQQGSVPPEWRDAIVIPVPKEQPADLRSDRCR
ncbi:Integrator complex subunit 7 [Branchiostoma belcheri]|nr:Integrator complex subunit 7 [Branchiostoma belcheri]